MQHNLRARVSYALACVRLYVVTQTSFATKATWPKGASVAGTQSTQVAFQVRVRVQVARLRGGLRRGPITHASGARLAAWIQGRSAARPKAGWLGKRGTGDCALTSPKERAGRMSELSEASSTMCAYRVRCKESRSGTYMLSIMYRMYGCVL